MSRPATTWVFVALGTAQVASATLMISGRTDRSGFIVPAQPMDWAILFMGLFGAVVALSMLFPRPWTRWIALSWCVARFASSAWSLVDGIRRYELATEVLGLLLTIALFGWLLRSDTKRWFSEIG